MEHFWREHGQGSKVAHGRGQGGDSAVQKYETVKVKGLILGMGICMIARAKGEKTGTFPLGRVGADISPLFLKF